MFYFDTAIESEILHYWSILVEHIDKKQIAGITTNPNALLKAHKATGLSPAKLIEKLANLLHELRGDSKQLREFQH